MSDKINSITIVFEEDVFDRDADRIVELLKGLRGVISATPNVSNFQVHAAEMRVRSQMRDKIHKILKEL